MAQRHHRSTGTTYVVVGLPPKMRKAVEAQRIIVTKTGKKLRPRTEAIRYLIELGLEVKRRAADLDLLPPPEASS